MRHSADLAEDESLAKGSVHGPPDDADIARLPPTQPAAAGAFNLPKAVFETAIVAIGVLLALLVDEARQARDNRQLADEAIAAMREELADNRSRFIRKLEFLRAAHRAIEADPARAAELVMARGNQQITPSNSAWVMTVETGALRLLEPAERDRYAKVYTAQQIYYDLVTLEMSYWSDLAAFDGSSATAQDVLERDKAIRMWKAWANRVSLGVCISTARIELVFHPDLDRERLWEICRTYRLTQPATELYRKFGVPMPVRRGFL